MCHTCRVCTLKQSWHRYTTCLAFFLTVSNSHPQFYGLFKMIIGRGVPKKETSSRVLGRAKWVRNSHEQAASFINIETLLKKPPNRVISAVVPAPRQLLNSHSGHMLCCTLLSKALLKVFVSLSWILLLEKTISRSKLFPLTLQQSHHFETYPVFLCVIFIHPLDKLHKVTLFCLVLNIKKRSHITLGMFLPPIPGANKLKTEREWAVLCSMC